MLNFYIGLSLIGAILIVIALFSFLLDYKNANEERISDEQRKKNLEELLSDADQMVSELNKFSDYVVTKVDEKSSELRLLLQESIELKVNIDSRPVSMIEPQILTEAPKVEIEPEIQSSKNFINNTTNDRHSEVIRLFEEGMSDIEIARELKMGRGEIQLIIGMNLHRIKT